MDAHKNSTPLAPPLSDPSQRHARNVTLLAPFNAVHKHLKQGQSAMYKTSKRALSEALREERQTAWQALEEQIGNLYIAGTRWQRTAEALAETVQKYSAALSSEAKKPMLTLDYLFDPTKHPIIYEFVEGAQMQKAKEKKRTKNE